MQNIADIKEYTEMSGRRKIIEPHYSVLELLETDMGSSSGAGSGAGASGEILDLSDSWQVLSSSSENSDEEETGNVGKGLRLGLSASEEVNNQFIMPRLSYSKSMGSINVISVVGSKAELLRRQYLPANLIDFYFKVDPRPSLSYDGGSNGNIVLYVVQDHSELLQLVKVSNNILIVAVVVVIDKRQNNKLEVVKNCNKIVKNMKKSNNPRLYYPDLILIHENSKNHEEINTKAIENLLHFLRSTGFSTFEIKNVTNPKKWTSEILINPNKSNLAISSIKKHKNKKVKRKNKTRVGIPINSKKKSGENNKKPDGNSWFYTISISISIGLGLGVGFCLSCVISSSPCIPFFQAFQPSETHNFLTYADVATETETDLLNSTMQNNNDIHIHTQTWDLVSTTFRHICTIIKCICIKPIRILGSNWTSMDDPDRIIAMSYVVL